jgi:hypothetical protein
MTNTTLHPNPEEPEPGSADISKKQTPEGTRDLAVRMHS